MVLNIADLFYMDFIFTPHLKLYPYLKHISYTKQRNKFCYYLAYYDFFIMNYFN